MNSQLKIGINNTSSEWFRAVIDKKELKKLSKRSDWPAWTHMLIYFPSIIFFGYLTFLFWGTWWVIIPYLIYATIYAAADAIWHECGHRTAFRSRKFNDFFYHIACFMNNFEPIRWRWSHSLHHSYTASIDPHDFEIEGSIFKQWTLISFILNFIPGIGLLKIHESLQKETLMHALGFLTPVMRDCIPFDQQKKCRLYSRIHVFLWVLAILISIYLQTFLFIFLFIIPKYFGTLNGLWGITQHIALQANVKDHRLSTRSIRLNPIFSFLYWKMEYHIEHHMFPMVPSYNLPKLHELIKDQLPKPNTSLYDTYKEILPAINKISKDKNYFIPIQLP